MRVAAGSGALSGLAFVTMRAIEVGRGRGLRWSAGQGVHKGARRALGQNGRAKGSCASLRVVVTGGVRGVSASVQPGRMLVPLLTSASSVLKCLSP
jgi:hypothetical protein